MRQFIPLQYIYEPLKLLGEKNMILLIIDKDKNILRNYCGLYERVQKDLQDGESIICFDDFCFQIIQAVTNLNDLILTEKEIIKKTEINPEYIVYSAIISKVKQNQIDIEKNNVDIKNQIADIEEKSKRTIRELLIDSNNKDSLKYLQDYENKIAGLRNKLK
jgi:hypothetical protein